LLLLLPLLLFIFIFIALALPQQICLDADVNVLLVTAKVIKSMVSSIVGIKTGQVRGACSTWGATTWLVHTVVSK
ncbi:hypothetical protein FRC11_002741, partial [Ceratobasidium sp. 423]